MEKNQNVGLDRYLTKENVLDRLASIVKTYIEPGMMFVDFSCGKNTFGPRLGCDYLSFDIVSAKNATQQDWLTVKTLPKNIVCGLNPPFGYQGKTARLFIEHACNFRPRYLFLILPHMRWAPPDYESIYSEKLDVNSFYTEGEDVLDEKSFSYPTWFRVLKLGTGFNSNLTSLPSPIPLSVVHMTRRWNKDTTTPTLIIRRVGRNTGRQAYCILDDNTSFVEKGVVYKNITWKDNQHSIESDYFLKCYFKEEMNLSLKELENLAFYIDKHPELGSETKQPPATTNRHFQQLISEWIKLK